MIKRLKKCITYTEFEVVKVLQKETIDGNNFVVMSKIAKEAGTSVGICSGVTCKLEIAGILTTKNLGSKGMYIEIINRKMLEDLIEGGIF